MAAMTRRDLVAGAGALAAGGASSGEPRRKVEVFGHRGACALRPEHTLASYALAIADGADYVEPDLCITRDGVLVVRHEPEIGGTTDVSSHPEFASRRTSKAIDGETMEGWFLTDFTLAELKTLRARERLPQVRPQNTKWDGAFEVPTFAEYLDFVAAESALRGRPIGMVPEIKHSTWHAAQGLPMEDRFLAALASHPYAQRAPLEIQSFETTNLRALRRKLGRPANLRLMQLTGEPSARPADLAAAGASTAWAELTSAEGLKAMATYADTVSPNSRVLIPLDPQGRLGPPAPIIRDAHAAGLLVRSWTFRPENQFLPADLRSDAGPNARNPKGSVAEIRRYIAAGLDGFFTDDPALGRIAVDGGEAPAA